MNTADTIASVRATVLCWGNISEHPHKFGGTEFRLHDNSEANAGKEIGHIHDVGVVDILFTKAIREQLVAENKAQPHHYVPQSGWTSYYLHRASTNEQEPEQALEQALWLLRLSYTFQVFRLDRNADTAQASLRDLYASPELTALILGSKPHTIQQS